MPRIREIIKNSSQRIKDVTEIPKKEVIILLSYFLKKDTVWIMTHEDEDIDIPQEFFGALKKREEFYPLEYITKSTQFYSKDFYTDDRVLIPRPESEILVDKAILTCKEFDFPKVAEIGTGSGILSITLALMVEKIKITATDISKDTLEVAKINAEKHKIDSKITFVHTNLLDGIDEKPDILISNPPYIKRDESLDKNLSYEPDLALFGGEEGDELLKKIIDITIKRDIKYLICEMGYDQKEKIERYCSDFYNVKLEFYKDLAGFDRGFVLSKNLI